MYKQFEKCFEKFTKRSASLRVDFWLILIISVVFFPTPSVSTSPDSAWYVSSGLNIFHGYGYVNTDHLTSVVNRGPVFPFLMALSFWFFGVSIHSAVMVVRLFFVLNNLMIYKLGEDLFGRKVGLLAALLCLFSATIHQWSSYLLLDNVWPFFILLFFWLHFKACLQKRLLYFVLAGGSLSIAFLTKELSLLWLPLPLIYVLVSKAMRCRENMIGISVLYLTFFLSVLPWGIHIHENCGTLRPLFGRFANTEMQGTGKISQALSESSKHGMTAALYKLQLVRGAYSSFYHRYIETKFAMPGIFILISYAVIFFRALFFRNKSDALLATALFCLLPFALGMGIAKLRTGQTLILYFLSLLSFANCIILLCEFAVKKVCGLFSPLSKEKDLLTTVSTMVVIGVMLSYHFFGNDPGSRKMLNLLKGAPASAMAFVSPKHWPVGGWHNEKMKNAGHWIRNNIPQNCTIMCEWFGMRSIYFFDNGRNKMIPVPIRQSNLAYPMGQHETHFPKNGGYFWWKCENPPLFLWPNHDMALPTMNLFAFCECDVLDRIRSENVSYVVVTKRRNFLSLYFDENPCFRKVREMNQGEIKIYKVQCVEPVSGFELRVGSHLIDYLKVVEEKKPKKYEFLVNQFMANRLGFSEEGIQSVFEGIYPNITKNALYGCTENKGAGPCQSYGE